MLNPTRSAYQHQIRKDLSRRFETRIGPKKTSNEKRLILQDPTAHLRPTLPPRARPNPQPHPRRDLAERLNEETGSY
jgi:hypothetical protein